MTTKSTFSQSIINKSPYTTYLDTYMSPDDDMPSGFGEFHRFIAAADPNAYIELSEGNNSLTPIVDLSDNALGFTTRIISGATKSTNSGDITFDSDELIIALRPGSGFSVTRQFASNSLQAVTTSVTLDMTGPTSTDKFSALWAVG